MEITQEHKTRIEEIFSVTDCPKDFKCYKSDFEDLSKIQIFREGELVKCLEDRAQVCQFSFHFGHEFFCKCPIRKYVAQNFNK